MSQIAAPHILRNQNPARPTGSQCPMECGRKLTQGAFCAIKKFFDSHPIDNPGEMDVPEISSASLPLFSQSTDPSNQPNSLLTSVNGLLDTYCQYWKDKCSYILPPVFQYRNHTSSDEHFDYLRRNGVRSCHTVPRSYADRKDDEIAMIVFENIQRLIRDDFENIHPFVTFRGFSTNRMRTRFENVLPGVKSPEAKSIFERRASDYDYDFDFVLIGPKIGLIFLQIMADECLGRNDFTSGFRSRLKQLKTSDSVLELLKIVSNRSADSDYGSDRIRKVLVTPNLKRSTYEAWLSTLEEKDRAKIRDHLDGIIVWFQEDMRNDPGNNPPPADHQPPTLPSLYDTLRGLLQSDSHSLRSDLYESIVPVMTVMASIVKSPSSTPSPPQFTLDKWKLSEFDFRESPVEILKIWNNEPRGMNQADDSTLFSNTKIRLDSNRSIFLTREQDKALIVIPPDPSDTTVTRPFGSSGDRRLIIGIEGTGKTILLQSKAMDLMRKGSSVAIFCSEHSIKQYQRIFDANGFVEGQYRLELLSSLINQLVQGGAAFEHSVDSSGLGAIDLNHFHSIPLLLYKPAPSSRILPNGYHYQPAVRFGLLCLFIALHHNDKNTPDVSYTSMDKGLADMIETCDSKLCAIVGEHDVFIDDTSEMETESPMGCRRVIAIMIGMYLERQRNSRRTFWATFDPVMWQWTTEYEYGVRSTILPCVACKDVLEWINFTIKNSNQNVRLRVNLRSPINVFRSIFSPTIEQSLIERFRPRPGPKVLGPAVTLVSIEEIFPSLLSALEHLSSVISAIFTRLANEGVHWDQIGVIYQCVTTGPGAWPRMIAGHLCDCWKIGTPNVDEGSVRRQIFNCADISSMEGIPCGYFRIDFTNQLRSTFEGLRKVSSLQSMFVEIVRDHWCLHGVRRTVEN